MAKRRDGRKGTFGDLGLPVARAYPLPPTRRVLIGLGLLALLMLGAVIAWDSFAGRQGLISGGPLSSSHAVFTDDCSRCHDPGERRVVRFALVPRALSYWDPSKGDIGEWVAEPGEFELRAGASSRDIRSRATFTLRGR